MFEIKPAYPSSVKISKSMVVDEERGVWLQRIGKVDLSEPSGVVFKLVWGERVIPFEVETVSKEPYDKTPSNFYSQYYLDSHFSRFGSSPGASFKAGISGYHFEDNTEREAAELLALEAMLAYGDVYDGYIRPDGCHRFHYGGKVYIKSDFGLP